MVFIPHLTVDIAFVHLGRRFPFDVETARINPTWHTSVAWTNSNSGYSLGKMANEFDRLSRSQMRNIVI